MKLLLLSFLLCATTLSYAKHPQTLNTLQKDPNAEGENQTFGRLLLMKGVISPSNDVVDKKIKKRKKRRGLRKVVVVPPKKTMVQKK
jgi:hypothetical protein